MKIKTPKDKWLPAFIVAALVAVAAIVVAIVVGVTPQEQGVPTYVEGAETGVYYYDVVDGEIVLTFSNGHNFTIAGPRINKTGTYTADGTTITLDFFKDEDGTTTATLDGDKVALVYDNATMLFTKKISYTVNFNVNGGSAVEAVSVINGKTAAKPADPTKENAVFLGWYADEAFTTPYSFDTDTVKENITVYARWADKPTGVPEFMISFDLGYEGAEAPEAMSTIGGIAYDVPTPQRSGYTFVGWYISMYEDGQKLSYAYTAETQFAADTTLYAVWSDDSNSKLHAPAVTVTDKAVTWDAVKGAASYKLTVIDPKGNVVIDNETVGATVRAFDFTSADAGEYQVSVVAVAGNEENNSEPTWRYYANKALDRVSSFTVENGILIFGAVENAQKYTITIDCGNDEHVHTAFDNGNSTIFYIANCPMQEGGILVTVTASANGYATSTSKVFVYNKVLDKIEQIVYDAENDRFVWNAVDGTASYQVTVTVDGEEYTFDNGTGTSFSIAGFTGEITVSVKPVTEGYNSPEAAEASCKKTAPAAPDGLTATGMVIGWNSVAGATAYEVNVGGQTVTVDTNSLNLAEGALALTQGQLYTVKVRAINANNESSSYSESMEVGYYVMNPVLHYNRNTVSWSPVLGVNQYQIRINGGAPKIVTDVNFTRVTLTKEGENLIEVRYVMGENASEWVSMTVTAYAVEYDTRSVAYGTVHVEYLAVGDEMSLPETGFSYDGYDFGGWYNAPMGAIGNGKEYADGAVFNGNACTVLYAAWTPKEYNVTLKTDGFEITNIENGAQETVTFSKDFALTVPSAKDTGMYFFAGWYTGPSGTGVQVTDENGKSVRPYNTVGEMILYPYYSTDALTFILQADGTYGVKKGPAIESVTNLVIPSKYNEIRITNILESAFSSCTKLISVKMPDTIKLVGASAFTSCSKLESIEVYKAEEGVYETFYSSVDGVLLRDDMGTMYLEVVPRAMTGDYVIPDGVQKVLPKAFYYTQISSVTIPNSVTVLPKYAFYYCKNMTDVVFAPGRTNLIEYEKSAFYGCDSVERITMPAILDMDLETTAAFLNMFKGLKSVEMEEGGATYASVAGLLTDNTKSTILYCPTNYSGDLVLPKGISGIGEAAFQNHDKITSITIPIWVTSIGVNAFEGCDGVKSVTFLDSRSEDLTIGDYAFANMLNLLSVTFEGNDTAELDKGKVLVGQYAFQGHVPTSDVDAKVCRLNKVEIGAGVNIPAISAYMFNLQSRLSIFRVDPSAYVGEIGDYAFAGCNRFGTFEVPATVTKIGQYAFSECIAMSGLTFSEAGSTLTIGGFAFNGCTRLTSVTLPSYLEAFESTAFTGCIALAELKIGTGSDKFINDANGILYRKAENSNEMAELLFYPFALVRSKNGVVNDLPETLTAIGGAAFSNNNYLISITIPKNVTRIGDSAFTNCTSLETVIFAPDGTAMVIENSAFLQCVSLENIDMPACTTSIGDSAFEGCLFTKIVIPAKVTSIGKAAFKNCVNLTNVIFNSDVDLTIGANAADYTEGAFTGCTALKSISLPTGVTKIGKYTFYNCYALGTVNFAADAKLQTIDAYAFAETALKNVTIPKSVTSIGTYAFSVKSIYSYKVGKTTITVTGIGEAKLETVAFEQYGTGALSIAANAFANQANLTSITLPARLQTLNVAAQKPNYTKAAAYNTVFTGCAALAEINIDNDLVEGVTQHFSSLDGVLYNADQTSLLYCPAANVGRYDGNGRPTYEVIVPNTVQTVFSGAFHNATGLKTVTFQEFDKENENYGKQLLTIGNYAYTGTSSSVTTGYYAYDTFGGEYNSITTINLPSHLSKINSSAFGVKDKTNLVTLNFNPDANNIDLALYTFRQSTVLSVKIPGTLKSMATHVFYQASHMTTCSFNLPESIKKIPNYTFYQCNALTGFEVSEHVTEIGQYAFYYCSALAEMNLSSNVYKIDKYAFAYTGIESFYLPASVTSLGDCSFMWSPNLKTFEFGLDENGKSPITKIPNNMFCYCQQLETVKNIYKLDLTAIGNSAFRWAKFKEFDFSQFPNLLNIGSLAFADSALVSADLSSLTNLTNLNTMFQGCLQMKTLVLAPNMNSWGSLALYKCTGLETIVFGVNTSANMLSAMEYPCTFVIPEGNPFLVIGEDNIIYDPNYQIIYGVSGTDKDMTGYTFPATVTTIADGALRGTKFDKLIIPEGIVSIGAESFYGVETDYISIPASVETIGSWAFGGSTVKEFVFANEHQSKLNYMGGYAFWYCDNLEELVLPDNFSMTVNQASYVYNCSNLKRLVISAATTDFVDRLLEGCYNLEELVLQEGLLTIPPLMVLTNSTISVGDKINNVKSINIPSTVQYIEKAAFVGFCNLETVTIAEGTQLQNVGDYAFFECNALKTISALPSTVTAVGIQAFANCYALESVDLSETLITTIGQKTFFNTSSMASVALPQSLLSIDAQAFYNTGVVDLMVPLGVESIGYSAFENAAALKTVTFESGSIFDELGDVEGDSNIFRGTTSLETVVLPNAVRIIGNRAFENSGIRSITLADPTAPSGIDIVGKKAFANCANLASFDLLENATMIDDAAFFQCTSLQSAQLHEKLEYLGVGAFGYCTNLNTAYIPASVSTLAGNPYIGLDKSKINLNSANEFYVAKTDSNGVLTIMDTSESVLFAVYGASGAYDLSNVNMVMGGAFAENDITEIVLPKRVTFIGDYLFMNCRNLRSVTIQGEVDKIGEYAFYNTDISEITISDGVTSIGDYAFTYCDKLSNVYIPVTDSMTFGNYVFAYCTSLSNVEFEQYKPSKTNFYPVLGTHMFYECSSLTQVALPMAFKNSTGDSARYGTTTVNGVIPSYMFAGTGIVEAILPASVDYCFTDGVFANCKKLERIFMTDQPSASNLPTGIINPSWIEGCDNFQYLYSEYLTSNYAWGLICLSNGGFTEFHLDYLLNPEKYTSFYSSGSYGAYLERVSENFELYVHKMTWQEMISYFQTQPTPWTLKIFDKDGNRLVCSEENGSVAYVLDKNGNKIWEAAKE